MKFIYQYINFLFGKKKKKKKGKKYQVDRVKILFCDSSSTYIFDRLVVAGADLQTRSILNISFFQTLIHHL